MKKSLVTGGAGFIGSHIADELLGLKHHVVILDDLSGGFIENVPAEAEFIEGSILDIELLQSIFTKHKIDYIFHFAAYAAEGLSHFIKRFNYQNNLIGSVNLINEAVKNKVDCFVFASSIAVYGSIPPPMQEDVQPTPEDPYAIAKYAVEQDLVTTKEMFDLDYIVFRPHNVYGERQNLGDKYRNVIGIFMNQVMQKKSLTIFGDGEQTRAFSYIKDISFGMANSINIPEARNQVFNVGADKQYTINELANSVKSTMKADTSIEYVEARNEVIHAYADHTKFKTMIGNFEQTPLKTGLKKMLNWAVNYGVRVTPRFKNIEIEENLPPIWKE